MPKDAESTIEDVVKEVRALNERIEQIAKALSIK
jgi:hypothetical protein